MAKTITDRRISAVDARGAAARHLYADVPVLYGLVIRRQMRISFKVSLPLAPHEPSGIFVVSEAVFPEERFTDIHKITADGLSHDISERNSS